MMSGYLNIDVGLQQNDDTIEDEDFVLSVTEDKIVLNEERWAKFEEAMLQHHEQMLCDPDIGCYTEGLRCNQIN